MFAYVDQNFLITASDDPAVSAAIGSSHRSGKSTLVLSPMHFFEIGKIEDESRYEKRIRFVEAIKPQWALTRADLELFELLKEWTRFWKTEPFDFESIGDLAYVASKLHRVPPDRLVHLSPRDFIGGFHAPEALDEMGVSIGMNITAAQHNREKYREGKITPEFLRHVEKRYVALQLARRDEKDADFSQMMAKVNSLLGSEPIATKISIFVENGGVSRLKAFEIERALTNNRYPGEAKLNRSRLLDRDHAVVALTCCDAFLTDDGELTKYCNELRRQLTHKVAEVYSCGQWLGCIKTL